jgi:hypothetical protein
MVDGQDEPMTTTHTSTEHHRESRRQPRDTRPRIVIADDCEVLRDGVSSLLRCCGFSVVGKADCGEAAIRLVAEARSSSTRDAM